MNLPRILGYSLLALLALLILAAIGVFVKMLALFLSLLLAIALVPILLTVYAKIKLRSKKWDDIYRTESSVLKHVWEEQQHREW